MYYSFYLSIQCKYKWNMIHFVVTWKRVFSVTSPQAIKMYLSFFPSSKSHFDVMNASLSFIKGKKN